MTYPNDIKITTDELDESILLAMHNVNNEGWDSSAHKIELISRALVVMHRNLKLIDEEIRKRHYIQDGKCCCGIMYCQEVEILNNLDPSLI